MSSSYYSAFHWHKGLIKSNYSGIQPLSACTILLNNSLLAQSDHTVKHKIQDILVKDVNVYKVSRILCKICQKKYIEEWHFGQLLACNIPGSTETNKKGIWATSYELVSPHLLEFKWKLLLKRRNLKTHRVSIMIVTWNEHWCHGDTSGKTDEHNVMTISLRQWPA